MKQRYLYIIIASLIITLILLYPMKCLVPSPAPNDYKHLADSLRTELTLLTASSLAAKQKYEDSIASLNALYIATKSEANDIAEKHKKLIGSIKGISQDSAHNYMKKNYTPIQAMTITFRYDSCLDAGNYCEKLLAIADTINRYCNEYNRYLEVSKDSVIAVADTCIKATKNCATDLEKKEKENGKLKKQVKILGYVLIVTTSSIILQFVLNR